RGVRHCLPLDRVQRLDQSRKALVLGLGGRVGISLAGGNGCPDTDSRRRVRHHRPPSATNPSAGPPDGDPGPRNRSARPNPVGYGGRMPTPSEHAPTEPQPVVPSPGNTAHVPPSRATRAQSAGGDSPMDRLSRLAVIVIAAV